MKKRALIIAIIIMSVSMFSSCGIDYRLSLDENIHGVIECYLGNNKHEAGMFEYQNDEELPHIIYKDVRYIYAGRIGVIQVQNKTDDVMLSWNGNRFLGYIDEYYSYTEDDPLYIYDGVHHIVYFREDYNYFSDTFVIENTDEEIIFSDIISSQIYGFSFDGPVNVVLRSKMNPRVKIVARLESVDGQWYISFQGTSKTYYPSDTFLNNLRKSGFIQ